MKVHYINILLFALPLNILEYNQRNHNSTTPHHPPNTRLLCECELYTPANYDNDPQMKEIMHDFDRQTSQRFEEYNERMNKKRQKCKDKCDKEIQKIILKDKLEKELAEKFVTLQTDIQSDAIPTCVCEKSLADKVEKTCLRCGSVFGGGIAPSVGILGGIGEAAISAWKVAALKAAIAAAKEAGAAAGEAAGKAAGMNVVTGVLRTRGIEQYCPNIFKSIQKIEHFTELKGFIGPIIKKHGEICGGLSNNTAACEAFDLKLGALKPDGTNGPPPKKLITGMLDFVAGKAETTAGEVAKKASESVTAAIKAEKTGEIASIYASWKTAIIAAVVAIVVIVLIMVIIYLILRYRRKKKMKKKLQYIKLLEE
ncbi:rifin [Plasmodium falciparum IGH-CR14]|uniref:Rifin n=1 Tax=Plasmodium falciparum IGH-CR14 TaxID=580059 RepID=A0A0L1I5M4_PLAFA|nr:rifin [Plasmodium falciparum IGH-CR14]